MTLESLIPGIVGTTVGVVGWLLVGVYIQRRQFVRQAMNAGRAVYFELAMNRVNVALALEYGPFTPLSRSTFERLLPELATWLDPQALRTIVDAYMSHAGYEQAGRETDLPEEIRREALAGVRASHDRAIAMLGQRAFSAAEVRGLADYGAPPAEAAASTGRTAAESRMTREPQEAGSDGR
jgi:hypothetical protein